MTALHHAVRSSDKPTIECFHFRWSDLIARDTSGLTIVHYVAMGGYGLKIIDDILEIIEIERSSQALEFEQLMRERKSISVPSPKELAEFCGLSFFDTVESLFQRQRMFAFARKEQVQDQIHRAGEENVEDYEYVSQDADIESQDQQPESQDGDLPTLDIDAVVAKFRGSTAPAVDLHVSNNTLSKYDMIRTAYHIKPILRTFFDRLHSILDYQNAAQSIVDADGRSIDIKASTYYCDFLLRGIPDVIQIASKESVSELRKASPAFAAAWKKLGHLLHACHAAADRLSERLSADSAEGRYNAIKANNSLLKEFVSRTDEVDGAFTALAYESPWYVPFSLSLRFSQKIVGCYTA